MTTGELRQMLNQGLLGSPDCEVIVVDADGQWLPLKGLRLCWAGDDGEAPSLEIVLQEGRRKAGGK